MFRNVRLAKTSKLPWHTYTVILVLVLIFPKLSRAQTGDTAYGTGALANDTTYWNSAFGFNALFQNNACCNTATGYLALYSNQSGIGNTAAGAKALYTNTASYNTANGYGALYNNATGFGNTADGFKALLSNTTWNNNTAIGFEALYSSNSGGGNTATGSAALYSNAGHGNTASGRQALYSNTTGYYNTAVGLNALYSNTTGSLLTCVGYNCNASNLINATAIGAFAEVSENNALVLGSINGVNGATSNTNVGIGTTAPSHIFTIGQGFGRAIADGWNTYSSRRWKTNIHPLENALSKVEQLRGVSYDLKDSGKHEIGVIAEEVGQVVPEVVSYEQNGKDATGLDYSRLTALLIEAVKQQQQEISTLRRQLQRRAAKEAALESRLEQLEQQRSETQLASAHPVR